MILYELHAYPTTHYDRLAERRIRLKDTGMAPDRVFAWIAAYLAEHRDGKVVASVVEKRSSHCRGGRVRRAFVETVEGRSL